MFYIAYQFPDDVFLRQLDSLIKVDLILDCQEPK